MGRFWPLFALIPVQTYLVFLHPVGLATSAISSDSFPTSPLNSGVRLSQTFSLRANGLREVRLFPLVTGARPSGQLVTELRLVRPDGADPLVFRIARPLAVVARDRSYRFRFSPLDESFGQTYRIDMAVRGTGAAADGVRLWASPAGAYGDGSLLVNGRAQPADLARGARPLPGVGAKGARRRVSTGAARRG